LAALLTGASALLAPAAALACPACAAGRATAGGSLVYVALGALITLPFVVSGLIIGWLRAEQRAAAPHGALDEFTDGTSNPDTRARRRVE
jgi:hypothetical protein